MWKSVVFFIKSCLNTNGNLVIPPLKSWHGRLITSKRDLWIYKYISIFWSQSNHVSWSDPWSLTNIWGLCKRTHVNRWAYVYKVMCQCLSFRIRRSTLHSYNRWHGICIWMNRNGWMQHLPQAARVVSTSDIYIVSLEKHDYATMWW